MCGEIQERLLGELIFGSAEVLQGWMVENDELDRVVQGASHVPWRVVRDWMILDVQLSPAQEQSLAKRGVRATALFAGQLLSQGADPVCDLNTVGVLSGFKRGATDCLFEDEWGDVYLLAGRGARKTVPVEAYIALHACLLRERSDRSGQPVCTRDLFEMRRRDEGGG